MDRSETIISVAGLLATFLLPWPGADHPHPAETQQVISPSRVDICDEVRTAGSVQSGCESPARTTRLPPARGKQV